MSKKKKKKKSGGPHMATELVAFLVSCRQCVDVDRQKRDFEYTDHLGNTYKIGLSLPMLAARAGIGDGTVRKFLGGPYCDPGTETKNPTIRVLWSLLRATGRDLKVMARQARMDQSDSEIVLSMSRIHSLARNGLFPPKIYKEIKKQVAALRSAA